MINTNVFKNFFTATVVKRFSGRFFAFLVGLIVSVCAYGQSTISVSGNVFDEQGVAVIGASVIVDGEKTGVITDINGFYTVQASPQGVLKVSFIGYSSQNVQIKNRSKINITLQEDAKILDEVVVVGYGTQKVKDVTASIAVITPKDFENLPVSNLGAALAGQVPGLSVSGGDSRPGEGATLSIRQQFGYSKDGNSNTPLVIIDDVIQIDPNTGQASLSTFNALDPSEVESISVLRDASAAIYGSRASQGAIIVKTKRGKIGAPKISYSGKFGFNDAVSRPKVLKGSAYGRFANSFNVANGKVNNDVTGWENKLYSDAELAEMDNLNYDWLDKAWSSASTVSNSVNVSGGGDRATYYAGATYFTQGANLGKQDYDRWNFRSGVDVKLTSDLKFSATLAATQQDILKSFGKSGTSINGYDKVQPGESGEYLLLSHMPNYIPWSITLDDGKSYYTSPLLNSYSASGNAKSNDQIGSWNYFAFSDTDGSFSKTNSFAYDANFSLTYAMPYVKGLTLKGSYALKRDAQDSEQVMMPYTLAYLKASDRFNPGTRFFSEHTSVADYNFDKFSGRSRVAYTDAISKNEQMNFFVNYNKKIGLHSIDGMVGVERIKAIQTTKQMLYSNPDPNSYLGTSPSAGEMDKGNSITSKFEQGSLSYFGRLSYNYADKYLFQFLFRSDASTKFSPANYWGFFPGASVGWVASEEEFFKSAAPKWIDYLKLRFSWGKTGKDNIKAWRWMQLYELDGTKGYGFGSNSGIATSGIKAGVTANPNAHWDSTTKYNLGLDLQFLRSRLTATIDYYYERNADMLNQNIGSIVGTPIFAGGAISEKNFGTIDAWGSEFSINWRDKVDKVHYTVGVNFGFNGNEIKKWPDIATDLPANNTLMVGRSTYMPDWGFKVWRGTSTGDGIMRTQQDIDNYWNYLTENANGGQVKYLGVTNKSQLRPGMLAYQDLGSDLGEDGVQKGPDGQIDKVKDYAKLANSSKRYGFTTKLGAEWKGLTFNMMISTSWGGSRQIDVATINTSSNQNMVWAPDSFWGDMFDEISNPNGKYPNIGMENRLGSSVKAPSDFWEVSTFRCFVRNLSIGYVLPKQWLVPLKVESAKLSVTGNNLWDLYNPYPDHYRNMYDKTTTLYPTLRTWSLGVNVTF